MKPISFIIPSRNNLKYLKQAYHSIRQNCTVEHEICMADDFSDDGTWEWMKEISQKDVNVKIHRNEGPTRLGHTILYDTLINDYATLDRVMIFHADMYIHPTAEKSIDKWLKPGKVVSLTRVEPPLHPDGLEKIIEDFGIEPEEFDEEGFIDKFTDYPVDHTWFINGKGGDKLTRGIFAPWAIYKKDFQDIGGHDPLYAPQSKEDSDIFNRFQLAGYELLQTWDGFVYHMTCRGSRFKDGAMRNPAGQVVMKGRESSEWLEQNLRSTRNFIRKWGHMVKHDAWMNPIIPPKYDVGFVVENCNSQMLRELEPWCSDIYGDWVGHKGIGANDYIEKEQPNTLFDLSKKIHSHHIEPTNDVILKFDCNQLTSDNFQILVMLSEIIQDSGEIGEFQLSHINGHMPETFGDPSIFTFDIKSLDTYEKDLIKV